MTKGSTITKIILGSVIFITSIGGVNAQSLPIRPSFPSCRSPQGELIVNYPSGEHGIAGDSKAYYGSDKVYELSADTLTQCFCSTNNSGIQTNWWRISSLSFEEVEALKKLGWIYVPNGAEWGLKEGPYMALSSTYSCSGGRHHSNDGEDDNNDKDDPESGQVLSAATSRLGEVLGLATTGSSIEIGLFTIFSCASLAAITYFISKDKKKS